MSTDSISLLLTEIDEIIEMAQELESHHAQGPDRHLAIYAGRIRNLLEFARIAQGPLPSVLGQMPLRPHSNGAMRLQDLQMQVDNDAAD